jgi:hypothetical protein
MRNTQVDSDSSPLFLFETIGIDSSQSFDECRLAVVDMPSRTYDDRFHLGES